MVSKLSLNQQLGRHLEFRGQGLAVKEVTSKGNICRLSDLDRLQQRTQLPQRTQLAILHQFTDLIRVCALKASFNELTTDRSSIILNGGKYEVGLALFRSLQMINIATTFGCQQGILIDRDVVNCRQKDLHLQVEVNALKAVIRAYKSFFGVTVKLPDNALMQSFGKLDQLKYIGREIFTVDPTGIYVFVYGQEPKLITETGSYAGPQVWADLVIARVIEPVAKQVKMAL